MLLLQVRIQHQKFKLTSGRLIWRMKTTWRLTLPLCFNLLSNLPLQGLQKWFQQLKRTHNTLWMHIGLSHQSSHLTVKLRLTTFSSNLSSAAQLHFQSWTISFLLNFWLAYKLYFYQIVKTGSFLNAWRLPSYACPDHSAFSSNTLQLKQKM